LLHNVAFIAALKAWFTFSADQHDKEQQEVGETKQANADLKAGLAAQERINQAQVNAPTTDAQWNEAAGKGDL
jgi:hypothetical protein